MKDGVPVNDDQGLEHEADMMGATVMQTRRSEKRALAFPLHQESMNLQGVIQRYIISVNHALRDPKATPSDDYGTYRSLDVAIAAGGGEIYKGVNTQGKGGRLDDFTSRTPPEEAKNVTLKKNEDLYLVGHGSKGSIGAIPPTTVAKAVAKITPNDWQGKIYSLNCWAGYKSSETQPSALDTLADLLGKAGRKGIEVSGPKGVSFRHKDWLKDKQLPLGAKAVFSYTENDESTYKDLIIAESTSSFLAGLKAAKVDDAFDHLLSFLNSKGYLEPEGTMTGVKKKAAFATEWGRPFQTKVVEKLETEATNSLAKARDEKRLLFGTEGIRTVKS
jgi:hypothetical protein